MKNLIAAVVAVAASVALANTYVPVEFILSDGYAYLDTGIPGNAKKLQQKVRYQFVTAPTAAAAIFGSYTNGIVSLSSCAVYVQTTGTAGTFIGYTGGSSGGYYFSTAPAANVFYDLYLHHGYAENYGGATAKATTGVGYNWNSLKNIYFSTLLVGNCHTGEGGLHTTPGAVPKIRWYSYEVIDHETGVSILRLTPAKCVETGAYGMVDSVNGGFYESEDTEHPFIGPDYVEWAGTDATYASNAIIVVPADTKVTVNHAAVAKLNSTGGIKVESETSVFSFSNCTGSASLYAPFWGPGEVFSEQSSGILSYYADNRAFAGRLSIVDAQTQLRHRYGFGLSNRVYVASNKKCEIYTGGAVSNVYCFARQSGQIVQQSSAPFSFAGQIYLDLSGAFSVNVANSSICFSGPVTNRLPKTAPIHEITLSSPTNCWPMVFDGGHDRFMGSTYIKTSIPLEIDGKLHFVSRGYGIYNNPQSYGQIGAANGGKVRFKSSYVLDEDVIFLMGFGYTLNPTPKGCIYLDGNDQQVGRLITGVGGLKADDRPQATSLEINSPTNAPAKLVIRNTAVIGHSPMHGYLPGCWPGLVTGAASVEINTATNIATAGTLSFTCAGSDTTGGLYARRGLIKLYETCSFTNLTELVASDEGQIEVLTSAIGGGAGGEALGGLCVALTNVAAGTIPLTIGEGCSITARTAVTRSAENPKWLEPGVYTKDNLPLCLAGDGELVVKEYGGPKGMLLLIR